MFRLIYAGHIAFLWVILSALVSCNTASEETMNRVEYLNHRAFSMRYTHPDSLCKYAQQALELSAGYGTGKAEAYNNLAFAALMKQDFTTAQQLYNRSKESSNNQLEHLISDVGMMRVCQRTASNKQFYDYYNQAARNIRRLNEEMYELDDHDRARVKIAESDFHLAASTYYYYMQQDDRAADELAKINLNEVAASDSVQWVYAMYVLGNSGLNQAASPEQKALDEFDNLFRALFVCRQLGTTYLEANIIQTYSELIAQSEWLQTIRTYRPDELSFVQPNEVPDSLLSLSLSEKSLALFMKYGDHYQIAGSYRSLAALLFDQGYYEEAHDKLQLALNEVNLYLDAVAVHLPDTCRLMSWSADSVSTDILLVQDYPLYVVPQWLANIRESLSLTCSALGDKMASDYNRNIYLDILDRTRQDLELQSRYEQLEQESDQLGLLLVVVVLLVLLGLMLFFYLNKRWRRRNAQAITRLEQVAHLCSRILACNPTDGEELNGLVQQLVSEDKALMDFIHPYLEWSEQYAGTLAVLEDEHEQIEQELQMHEQRVADHKRQSLDKRTCMSIVLGITPFLDRLCNEVRRLDGEEDTARRQNRYDYIRELVDRINEYNDILTQWIKMKQGMLSLQVENFALNELFETLRKGQRAFEQKQLTLQVMDTQAVVKADKSLTLFMLNTLAENARKYTPAGGQVTITAEATETYVEISVHDTGYGLSDTDRRRILEEKIYDAGQIGQDAPSDYQEELRRNKGFGFGLMNCKGIMDKYRKMNPLFQVCELGIDSVQGQGSRFWFRLPKGVKRFFLWLCLLLPSCLSASSLDSLKWQAARYADSTYYCNVDGQYAEALRYADLAFRCLNNSYRALYPHTTDSLSVRAGSRLVELDWWNQGAPVDYHIVLDVRNEAAVAALATCEWEVYRLNNQGYTRLYKLLAEDSSLEKFCQNINTTAHNRQLAIWLILVLLLAFLLAYYTLYFRHQLVYRMNMEQALQTNRNMLHLLQQQGIEAMLAQMYLDLNEIHALAGVALQVSDGHGQFSQPVCTPGELLTDWLANLLQEAVSTGKPQTDSRTGTLAVPLTVEIGNEVSSVGAFAFIQPAGGEFTRQDCLLNDLIMRYLAIMIYQTHIRLTHKQTDVELMEDEKRRVMYEENQLHVQNLILDNCLSALKHETMYYPNRIRQLVDRIQQSDQSNLQDEQIAGMRELVDYYKEVFTQLSLCASRQVVQLKLNRSEVAVEAMLAQAQHYLQRKLRKTGLQAQLQVHSNPGLAVLGDAHLLQFLMENLMDVTLQLPVETPTNTCFTLQAEAEDEVIRFTFSDPRGHYTQDYLNTLFYPDRSRMQTDTTDRLQGVQYLVIRQIVRDHEELCSHRGCRINAQPLSEESGYKLWFTLPIKKERYGRI